LARVTPIKSTISRRNVTEEQKKAEERYAHEKLVPTPETVSTTSTIHPFNSEHGAPPPQQDADMLKGVKSDVVSKLCCHFPDVIDLPRKLLRKLLV
jgi:hypothetical protein